ncbi:hypothetical protein ACA910_012611 [Epithemia clementina (nom. ined.)]
MELPSRRSNEAKNDAAAAAVADATLQSSSSFSSSTTIPSTNELSWLDRLDGFLRQGLAFVNVPINPGHVFMTISLYTAYSTFQDFKVPVKEVVVSSSEQPMDVPPPASNVYNQYANPFSSLERAAEFSEMEGAAGEVAAVAAKEKPSVVVSHGAIVSTANRAFRIATKSNIAVFAMMGALACYVSGADSFEAAANKLIRWMRPKRFDSNDVLPVARTLKQWFPHIAQRSDRDAMKSMTEQEELEYIYKKYIQSSELSKSLAETKGGEANNNSNDSN